MRILTRSAIGEELHYPLHAYAFATYLAPLNAGTPYQLNGTYSDGSLNLTGTITPSEWADPIALDFTFSNGSSTTITTATSATLPGDYLLDTYTTTREVTITPATDQDFTLTVPLCVSKLTLTTLDKVPSDVSQVRITINPDADPLTSLTFNPTTGLIASPASFTRTWDVTPAAGKQTGTFHLYLMADDFPFTTSIQVETLDSEGTPIATRTYNDITFNRAKVRTLNTNLFSGTTSGTLTFEEWTSEDPITIE